MQKMMVLVDESGVSWLPMITVHTGLQALTEEWVRTASRLTESGFGEQAMVYQECAAELLDIMNRTGYGADRKRET